PRSHSVSVRLSFSTPLRFASSFFFFFSSSLAPRDLHSFPTRRSSDLDRVPQRVQPIAREPLFDAPIEGREDMLRRRLKPAGAGCQVHARGPPVLRIGASHDQPPGLKRPDERRHGLFAQAGAGGELAQPQAVLLEQGEQDGAVGRPYLGEATAPEAGRKQLVPAL